MTYNEQVIVGAMYGVPSETSSTSQLFTMIFFVWGSLLAAGVLGALGESHPSLKCFAVTFMTLILNCVQFYEFFVL